MSRSSWPANGEPLMFAELIDPIMAACRHVLSVELVGGIQDVPWGGPSIGEREAVSCLDHVDALTVEVMFRDSDLGSYEGEPDAERVLRSLIEVAVRLGMEQGRRVVPRNVLLEKLGVPE